MIHGTRAGYQRGCGCLPCKAAEATYRQQLRRLKATGRQPLGALVPATEAWRRIRQLKPELETHGAIAQRLGHRLPQLQFGRQFVRLKTLLKIRRLYRQQLLLPPEDMQSGAPL